MKKNIIFLLIIMGMSAGLKAQSFDDDVRTLFEVDGSLASFQTSITEYLAIFTKNFSLDEDDIFLKEFEEELLQTDLDELFEMLLPVYKKNFTQEEITSLITFYESDLGKALVKKQPKIIKESMIIGGEWGQDLALKIENKLRERDNIEPSFVEYNSTKTPMSPDAFDISDQDEVQEDFIFQKDSIFIQKNIIGKWKFNYVTRTNGRSVNYNSPLIYEFKDDNLFIEISAKDTIAGRWSLDGEKRERLIITYNEPKLLFSNKNVIKDLPEEAINQFTISSSYLTISNIEENELVLLSLVIANPEEEANHFPDSRLVFLNYVKMQ